MLVFKLQAVCLDGPVDILATDQGGLLPHPPLEKGDEAKVPPDRSREWRVQLLSLSLKLSGYYKVLGGGGANGGLVGLLFLESMD